MEYADCTAGLFELPQSVLHSLRKAAPSGMIFQRADEDVLTFSPTPLSGGRRRRLSNSYRAMMFRNATRLAFLVLNDTVHVMAAGWRKRRRIDPIPA